jgi:hypothetical protein
MPRSYQFWCVFPVISSQQSPPEIDEAPGGSPTSPDGVITVSRLMNRPILQPILSVLHLRLAVKYFPPCMSPEHRFFIIGPRGGLKGTRMRRSRGGRIAGVSMALNLSCDRRTFAGVLTATLSKMAG